MWPLDGQGMASIDIYMAVSILCLHTVVSLGRRPRNDFRGWPRMATVLAGNVVPRSQGRSERAEQCSEHFWACSGHCTFDIVRWTLYVRHRTDLGSYILLPRWMSPFETKIKTDIPRFQHVDFG